MSDDGYRFPVDRTAILLFASAIGETNPVYWDPDHAAKVGLGDVIAPPTFPTASCQWDPDYPLKGIRRIPAPPAPASPPQASGEGAPQGAAGGSPGGGGGTLTRVLHGEERYEYFQPMQPGMVLRVSSHPGKTWEKEGRRGGTMRFSETVREYRDESGELVVRATTVGIVTGKAVED